MDLNRLHLTVLPFAAGTVLVATQYNTGSLPVIMVGLFDEESLEGARPLLQPLPIESSLVATNESFDQHQICSLRKLAMFLSS